MKPFPGCQSSPGILHHFQGGLHKLAFFRSIPAVKEFIVPLALKVVVVVPRTYLEDNPGGTMGNLPNTPGGALGNLPDTKMQIKSFLAYIQFFGRDQTMKHKKSCFPRGSPTCTIEMC